MPFDGIVMRAVTLELEKTLLGARIDKIYQPAKNEITLVLRQPGQTYRLFLSALAQEAGVYLTSRPQSNPADPPLFCMVLRKHLEGGRILSFTQPGLERIMTITCEVTDELGDKALRQIIIETMGKHSNIILLDPQHNKILDAIQKVTAAISRYRQVLPGLPYQSPPPQEKTAPWEVGEDQFYQKIMRLPLSQTLGKALLATYSGLGPQSAEELVARSGLDPSLPIEYCGQYELRRLWLAFSTAALDIAKGNFTPEVLIKDQIPLDFSALAFTRYPAGMRQSFSGMNEALDFYYHHKKADNLFRQMQNNLAQLVKKEIERCEKKAGFQLQAIQEARNADTYRLWGELLTAYKHALNPGREVEVANYYDPEGKPVLIPLDENLSIMENAQLYFHKYQKAKHAAQQAEIHHKETCDELEYLNSLSTSLENVTTLKEAEEIREEMKEAGYVKTPPARSGQRKHPVTGETSTPQKIVLDSWEIYLGKNNRQNDLIVTKIAKPEDVWFHTKDIPGSHVLVKNPGGQAVPGGIIEQAALLAAYYSKARYSTNVPVDYTLKKHVWKLKGAKPGLVHYENQRTVYVTPGEDRIKEILEFLT